MRKVLQLLCILMLVVYASSASAAALAHARNVFVLMANNPKYPELDDAVFGSDDGTYDNYYYIHADRNGIGQLHITTDSSNELGQDTSVNTTDGSVDGTFYISTTSGSRGYNDDVILMISVKPDGQGQLPSNLSIQIESAGYEFDLGDYEFAEYDADVINVTYDETDFASSGYGLHTYKPGPNDDEGDDDWVLPLYTGQTDFTNGEYLLFIDLKVGNIYDSLLTDEGSAKVDFTISGLTTSASFNAYAWCLDSNRGQGINWTQDTLNAIGTSSYKITYTGP